MTKRLSKDDRLWKLAFDIAEYSTCDRAKHGCVIARDGLILATGYNGALEGEKHCDEVGHELIRIFAWHNSGERIEDGYEDHCARAIHAEQNAITNAAIIGISIVGADWYITGVPCTTCSKMILRTHPCRIFMCGDRGVVNVDVNAKQIIWWRGDYGNGPYSGETNLATAEELKAKGVII